MDMTCTKEIEFVEQLRRQEISRGLGLATRDRIRAVRRERMRWAVSIWQSRIEGIQRGEGGMEKNRELTLTRMRFQQNGQLKRLVPR